MTTRMRAGMLGAAAGLLFVATPAAAQGQGPRWQAWLGCWQTSALASTPMDAPAGESMLCVVPTGEAEAVEIVSVSADQIESRSTIRADGAQHPTQREGCSGWESASWSSTGTRLYLRSEFTCEGGIQRTSSGMMAFSPDGDWIDVQSVAAGGNSGSPVVDTKGEFVGIIFDGNLHSLVGDFAYDDTQARAVSVDSRAIMEALRNVYGANALVEELLNGGRRR